MKGECIADGVVAGIDADGDGRGCVEENVAAVFNDGLPAARGHSRFHAQLRQGSGHRGHGAEPGQIGGGGHASRCLGRIGKEYNRDKRGPELGVTADIVFELSALLNHRPGHQIEGLAGNLRLVSFQEKER
jgi:hypothetical protein